MQQRILIVGAGQNQTGILAKSREMGYYTVAADGDPEAVGLALGDAGAVVNITDPDALTEAARRHGVHAVYPAAEAGVIASAYAAQALGLPGVSPDTARCLRDKLVMRRALESAGLPSVRYRAASSIEEAREAAERLGLPVAVKPADGNASKGVRIVDYIEDISLAFNTAMVRSASNVVLLEEYVEGDEFNVDGLVYEGQYRLGGITGKVPSPLPFRFDTGIFMPPMLDEADERAIEETVAAALQAINFHTGTTHVEVILSAKGPRIVEMAGRAGGGRIPTDLIPLTYGMDYAADSLRIALGHAPQEKRRWSRGTAVYWIETKSGVVAEVVGADEARAMPGIRDVVIVARPGDIMQHIVDCATRDRVGYVLAEGSTPVAAIERALAARARIEIRVNPTVDS